MSEYMESSEIGREEKFEDQAAESLDHTDSIEHLESFNREQTIELEVATAEPEAAVERSRDFAEAEAIEGAVVEMVGANAPATEDVGASESLSTTGDPDDLPIEGVATVVESWSRSGDAADRPSEEVAAAVEPWSTSGNTADRSTEEIASSLESWSVSGDADDIPMEEVAPVVEENVPSTEEADGASSETEAITTIEDKSSSGVGESEVPDSEDDMLLETDEATNMADEGMEIKEYWEPPEMYVYKGQDGSASLVDAQGNPLESPPLLNPVLVGDTDYEYFGWYPGMDKSEQFSISFYTPPTEGIFAYQAQDGSVSIVDENGNLIPSPPEISVGNTKDIIYATKFVDGVPEKVEIPAYVPSIENCYAYLSQDGTMKIVDASGKLVDRPPYFSAVKQEDGSMKVEAWVPGETAQDKVVLSNYEPPLENIYVYPLNDGTITVVDVLGNQLECPPHVTKIVSQGEVSYYITDPHAESSESQIKIPAYGHPMKEIPNPFSSKTFGKSKEPLDTIIVPVSIYAYPSGDGKFTAVDLEGKPINCPPYIEKTVKDGNVFYTAKFAGHPELTITTDLYVDWELYIPDTPFSVHTGYDGVPTVVDHYGKPLDCQPDITTVIDSGGQVHYMAEYAGVPAGTKPVKLMNYKPISAHHQEA